jgi:Rieske Fe-S protein
VLTILAGLLPVAAGAGLMVSPLFRRREPLSGSAGSKSPFLRVGPLDLLPADGVPRLFVLSAERQDAWTRTEAEPVGRVYLSRKDIDGEPRITAFTAACPHLGCAVDYRAAQNEFACPCHLAAFAADGSRLSGPSKRGLDPLAVELRAEDGGGTVIYVAFQKFRPAVEERTPSA